MSDQDLKELDETIAEEQEIVEASAEKEEKKKGYLLKERSEGSFYRTVRLPDVVEEDAAVSTYADGVLTVTMPKKLNSKPKKVSINVN